MEAIEALERVSYDIILMDCQMPELDGYQATQTIRKREQGLDGRGLYVARQRPPGLAGVS